MISALLILAASAGSLPGTQATAVATARIVAGVRVSLGSPIPIAADATATSQRTEIVRQESGKTVVTRLRLIEFQ